MLFQLTRLFAGEQGLSVQPRLTHRTTRRGRPHALGCIGTRVFGLPSAPLHLLFRVRFVCGAVVRAPANVLVPDRCTTGRSDLVSWVVAVLSNVCHAIRTPKGLVCTVANGNPWCTMVCRYYCGPHASFMKGHITVVAAGEQGTPPLLHVVVPVETRFLLDGVVPITRCVFGHTHAVKWFECSSS